MWLKAKRWLQQHHPWRDRRGGADHIWLTNHDEGACYMPTGARARVEGKGWSGYLVCALHACMQSWRVHGRIRSGWVGRSSPAAWDPLSCGLRIELKWAHGGLLISAPPGRGARHWPDGGRCSAVLHCSVLRRVPPSEIYNTSIMLTHWGRMDLDHQSNTAYVPDNYTAVRPPHMPRIRPTYARKACCVRMCTWARAHVHICGHMCLCGHVQAPTAMFTCTRCTCTCLVAA